MIQMIDMSKLNEVIDNNNIKSNNQDVKTSINNSKYYTQEELDTLLNFEHINSIKQTDETKYKRTWFDEGGEHFDYTNFDEFEKLGGNLSFAKLTVNKEHQDIIKKYWDLLNQADGNVLVAGTEVSRLFNNKENAIVEQYMNEVHCAWTEHATNGEYNDINQYMRNNKDRHDVIVRHYFETGEILKNNDYTLEETTITIEDDNTGVKTETTSAKDTNIPDSSVNQNNAEKIKQQESINNSEKPKTKTSKPDSKPKKKPDSTLTVESDTKLDTQKTKTPVDTVEIPKTEKPKRKYNPKKAPKIKSNTINTTKEQIKKAVKETGMKTKKLTEDAAKSINWGKVGKVGAVVGVAALVGAGVHKHNKKEKENKKNGPDRLTGSARKSEFWNQSYAAQMAKDISTYQYGKRMTGFVQG